MRTIPIRECYTNGDFLIYYSGLYKVINKQYHLIFIANKDKCIYDIALYPIEDVKKKNYFLLVYAGKSLL